MRCVDDLVRCGEPPQHAIDETLHLRMDVELGLFDCENDAWRPIAFDRDSILLVLNQYLEQSKHNAPLQAVTLVCDVGEHAIVDAKPNPTREKLTTSFHLNADLDGRHCRHQTGDALEQLLLCVGQRGESWGAVVICGIEENANSLKMFFDLGVPRISAQHSVSEIAHELSEDCRGRPTIHLG